MRSAISPGSGGHGQLYLPLNSAVYLRSWVHFSLGFLTLFDRLSRLRCVALSCAFRGDLVQSTLRKLGFCEALGGFLVVREKKTGR